ncbi:MAG: hypothetical protein U0136_04825 [Bdellovibrionota bacterium]
MSMQAFDIVCCIVCGILSLAFIATFLHCLRGLACEHADFRMLYVWGSAISLILAIAFAIGVIPESPERLAELESGVGEPVTVESIDYKTVIEPNADGFSGTVDKVYSHVVLVEYPRERFILEGKKEWKTGDIRTLRRKDLGRNGVALKLE